jgi:hypothetical protein
VSTVDITATLTGTEARRPPKQILRFDIEVRVNDGVHWILLHDTVRDIAEKGPSGIHTIDRYQLAPGCSVAWLKGTIGMIAFRVRSGGLVTIESLGLSRWGPLPPQPFVAGLTADSVTIDGRPLEQCFDEPIDAWPAGRLSGRFVGSGSALKQRIATPFDALPDIAVGGAASIRAAIDRGHGTPPGAGSSPD